MCSVLFPSCSKQENHTPVERYGKLSVKGSQLVSQYGKKIQLRGISSHGLQWYGKYANTAVLQWLRDDWNIDVWRAALYLAE
ncbi:MAG: hypothetical protein SNJ56_01685, partial [Termitinemataceae bacterium]